MLAGVRCRTVLAAARSTEDAARGRHHNVLVDCRPFLEHWRTFRAYNGYLPIYPLLQDLQQFAPPGFEVVLPEVPPGEALFATLPGQVLQAEVRPPVLSLPHRHVAEPTAVAERRSNITPDTAAAVQGGVDIADAPASASTATTHVATDPQVPVAMDTAPVFTEILFILLSPEFLPETVRIRVELPQSVHQALARVSAARTPEYKRWFPRLLPIASQTSLAYGNASSRTNLGSAYCYRMLRLSRGQPAFCPRCCP